MHKPSTSPNLTLTWSNFSVKDAVLLVVVGKVLLTVEILLAEDFNETFKFEETDESGHECAVVIMIQ